jgi:predicted nuclease of restriction endonuclease-like (RecB) superfamily
VASFSVIFGTHFGIIGGERFQRELERQIDTSLFEREMIYAEKNQLFIERSTGLTALRDSYVLEFLDIPKQHKEKQLRKAIVANMRDFILEFGKDFTLVGEEYRVQVGNTDFNIDLLLHNRELSCLVAIDLKIGRFKPDHLGYGKRDVMESAA